MKFRLLACTGALLACASAGAQVAKPTESLTRAAFNSNNTIAVPNILDTWGFEPGEGFSVGALAGQQGWTNFAAAPSVPQVTTAAPVTGVQHIQIAGDPGVAVGTLTGGFSPDRGVQDPASVSMMSVDIRITTAGGADYDVVPQTPSQGFLAARVKFSFLGDIQILDDTGGGLAFEDSGVDWPVNQVFNLAIALDPVANTIDYFIDGVQIYTSVAGVFAGTNFEQVVVLSDNFQTTDVGDFDNLIIDTDFQAEADMAVGITASPSTGLDVGDTFVYTVTGTNNGPGMATGVLFNLVLSSKVSFVSSDCGAVLSGNTVSWSVASVASAATTTCQITVAVVLGGDIQSSVSVSTASVDPVIANNSANVTVGFQAVPVPAFDRLGLLLTLTLVLGLGMVATRRA